MARALHHAAILAAGMACGIAAHAQATATSVERGFEAPPADARVMMRWWWFGPAVTKPELLRELTQMKAADIGGFEIQPVYPLALDDPQTGFRNLAYLSPAFLDDVRYVNDAAQTFGLRASLTLTSGWPYGGPATPVTEAAGALHLVSMVVAPGETSVPVPALANGENLQGVFLTTARWRQSGPGRDTLKMLPLPTNGQLRLTLPPNQNDEARTVLWFLSSRTGQQVKRAAVGAEGFVLDHFSKQAVDDHLRHVADPLMTAFGDHPPYSVFSDSLEVFASDWTPDFLKEFRARRGYDLTPHLPELFTSNPTPSALEVRHDWGQTLSELVDDNYLKTIESWGHAHHTLFRSQTYGDPAVSLSSNALVDLPEGEGPQWQQFSYTRWATSAAHVYGRPVVSSETWTWIHSGAFRATPLDMKAEADRFFLQGINQLMGHGWPYSPPSAGEPGWRFYAAGALNAHNPWWIVMPDVMRYMQRVSWILRQGQPANQIAVYLPEDDAYAAFTPGQVSLTQLMPHWITPALTRAVETAGYNFDYVDSAAILARGIHYPVLILPHVERMSPQTLSVIAQYCAHGGKVIALGRAPSQAPGLMNHAERSATVASLSKALFSAGHGQATVVADTEEMSKALHELLPSDMTLSAPAPSIGYIRRKLANGDIYFIANTANTPVDTTVSFRSQYDAGEWLNPDTGEASPLPSSRHIPLHLAPYESRVVLLDQQSGGSAEPDSTRAVEPTTVVANLNTGWHVRFEGKTFAETMPRLTSWTDSPETLYYSGVATYTKTVELPEAEAHGAELLLSFGKGTPLTEPAEQTRLPGMRAWFDPPIRDAAVIYINGNRAGSLWHPPYALDVTALMRPGKNTIEVRVANTAVNELAGQSQPDDRLLWARYGQRFTPQGLDHLQPLPSGLLGNVELLRER